MQRLEVSGAVRPIYGSLGVKWLNNFDLSTKCTILTLKKGLTPYIGYTKLQRVIM